ncbi:D-glycero-beta-D-manno-heptose-7-phosphate kinase [Candidatus Uabimicrobium sp. HlEnr_7]|uniref:D-glycero-beta-D-manno-heptose-7-phosphate kinase n=1 Tax=Candidatus Uabimicrobium helgolandensis TaxID=3095367 RepID=UPI0035573688
MAHYIHDIVAKFSSTNILLIGDIILDHYAFGVVDRISPESPIQILDVSRDEYRLGGASNVANNIAALDAQVTITGVIGNDENGKMLRDALKEQGIEDALFIDNSRPTTVKTRMIAQGQHLLRVDREKKEFLSQELNNKIQHYISENIDRYDAIVISDYAKGVLSKKLCQKVIQIAQENGKPTLVGPKGNDWSLYKNSTLISANRKETEEIVGFNLNTTEDIKKAGNLLLETLEIEVAVITLGPKGIFVATKDSQIHIKADAKEVFDVTGAGDTVLSLLSLCTAIKCSWKHAISLANTAAGIVVGKVGASTVTPEDLYAKVIYNENTHLKKLKKLADVIVELELFRNQGRTIVFTNGCFDLLHPGHIRYLEYCRNRGDILIVGLNSDASISRLKGAERPVVKENDRAEMLAALTAVDYVVIFEDDTPVNIIKSIQPDVLVKGADWQGKEVAGAKFIESYGGSVEFYPYQEGYSTTNIITSITNK